jgi:hypothetical protein
LRNSQFMKELLATPGFRPTATYTPIPEGEWDVFYRMSASDMAATLFDLAQRVNLRAFRKSPRGPKKPPLPRDGNAKQGHVSTARLLMARHG